MTIHRHEAPQTQRMSRLGFAPPEQNGNGVLYPALYIGVGRFGLMTIKRMRELTLERFGRTDFPHWRWLFIDTDTETIQDALSGPSGVALSATETLHLRLHRPTHYQHSGSSRYEKWLPNEVLYRIPREPSTSGLRSLGRLALFSNSTMVVQRLRSEIENFLSEGLMIEAEALTGLGMRTNRPRTHLITSLSGGTGSGMLVDLAYMVKKELQQVGYLSPKIYANLGGSPISGGPSMANAVATVKEIEYFSHPQTTYTETFETGTEPFTDKESPFAKCMVIPYSSRIPSTETLAHLLMSEGVTGCGKVVETSTKWSQLNRGSNIQFTTANVRRVIWPRTRLLQNTARQLAARVLESWMGQLPPDYTAIIAQEFIEWNFNRLEPGWVSSRLEQHAEKELGENASSFFNKVIGVLDSKDFDHQTCSNVMERLHGLLGNPLSDDLNERGDLQQALTRCTDSQIQEIDSAILSKTVSIIERPSLRLAGADAFLSQIEEYLKNQIENLDRWVSSLLPQCNQAYTELLQSLLAAGFLKDENKQRIATKKSEANCQALINKLMAWATARYRYLAADAARSFYHALLRRGPEYTREVSFCRLQADDYRRKLQTAPSFIESPIDQPVLPAGSSTLETAAQTIVAEIPITEIAMLDGLVQQGIKKDMRAIVQVFLKPNEYGNIFQQLLTDTCRDYLDERLEKSNALQAVLDFLPEGTARDQFLKKVFERAKISLKGQADGPSVRVIGLPESPQRPLVQTQLTGLFEGEPTYFANADQEIIFWTEGLYIPSTQCEKVENHPTPSRFDLNF